MTETSVPEPSEPREYEPPAIVSLGSVGARTAKPIGSIGSDDDN